MPRTKPTVADLRAGKGKLQRTNVLVGEGGAISSTNNSGTVNWETLGLAIRERRLARGLTLVALAAPAGLSQPFLSQVENGRARPSMSSLYRIAHALETTPQAFFRGPLGDETAPALLRFEDAQVVDVTSTRSESSCRLLLAGDAVFHVLEFDGLPAEFLEYWEHEGFEALYVIEGQVEVEVGTETHRLRGGDFLSYSARLPHRLRAISRKRARVLLVESKVEALQEPGRASHAPEPRVRRATRTRR